MNWLVFHLWRKYCQILFHLVETENMGHLHHFPIDFYLLQHIEICIWVTILDLDFPYPQVGAYKNVNKIKYYLIVNEMVIIN